MAHSRSKDKNLFSEIMDMAVYEILKEKQKPKTSNTNTKKPRNSLQKENNEKTCQEHKKTKRKPLGLLDEIKPVRKTATRTSLPPSQSKTEKKDKILPKIVVYEDPTDETNQKRCNGKNLKRLSKSWDGSLSTARRSYEKSPKLAISKTKNVRRSLNDLTVPNKKDKSLKNVESKKSPAKTKLKPDQTEFEHTLAKLESIFPNVDPEFLKIQFLKSKYSLSDVIEFLITKEKTNELPTKADYLKRLEMEKLSKKFMENFSVVEFLKIIPDPWEYFLKSEKNNCPSYVGHSLHYLKNKYKKHYMKDIQEALVKNEYSLYRADKELKKKSKTLKMRSTNRSNNECDAGRPTDFNMHFVQEVAFIENETKIKSHIKKAATARFKKFKEAEEAGSLLECQSCNDFSLLQDDVVNCPANHVFCKDCVVKYVKIEVDKNNFHYKCLLKCEEKFSIESLQAFLSPSDMVKIIYRNQLDEFKAAGIEDLAYCPFCYYVVVMPPDITIFKCLNPNCMMESCRLCKKLSHDPLKCNEVEKFDDTVLIELEEQEEDKKEDTNTLLKCTNCSGEFIKREDSNKMVCPCGATICSICRRPPQECQHFNTQPQNETVHNLSSSSSDDDDDGTKVDEEIPAKSSTDYSDTLLEMFLSDSQTF